MLKKFERVGLSMMGLGFVLAPLAIFAQVAAGAASMVVEPFTSSIAVEMEELITLNSTTPVEIALSSGPKHDSFVCSMNDVSIIVYRGGASVSSTDGVEYSSDAEHAGVVIAGDSRRTWAIAASGTPSLRCSFGIK